MNFLHDAANKFLEYIEVPLISTLSISFVSYSDIEWGMKFLVLMTTFGYTVWKWMVERGEKKRKREKEENDKQGESK